MADWLREKGHIADAVRDIGLRDADDSELWTYACQNGAVIVSKDEDFALRAGANEQAAVLWIRFGNVVNRVLFARLEQAWPEVEGHFSIGTTLVEVR